MFNFPFISFGLQICTHNLRKACLCISLAIIHGSCHRKRWRWIVIIPFPGLIFCFTRKWLGLTQPNKRQVITGIPIQKECHLYIVNQVTRFTLISFVSKMIHATLLFYWYLYIVFTHLNVHSLSDQCKLETVLQAEALTAACPCQAAEAASWELEATPVPGRQKKGKWPSQLCTALIL